MPPRSGGTAGAGKQRPMLNIFGKTHMPNTQPPITRLPAVPMTVDALMRRPMPEVQNYKSEVLPFFRRRSEEQSGGNGLEQDRKKGISLWQEYKNGFPQTLLGAPGNFYAVANFNLKNLEPDWCYQRLNFFDMKIARCLLGSTGAGCRMPNGPAGSLCQNGRHFCTYNMIWDVPIQHQEKFFLDAPGIWRKVVPSGQFDLQVIGEGAGEAAAVRTYSGKTFHPRWTIDNTITSTELRRKHRREILTASGSGQ